MARFNAELPGPRDADKPASARFNFTSSTQN